MEDAAAALAPTTPATPILAAGPPDARATTGTLAAVAEVQRLDVAAM